MPDATFPFPGGKSRYASWILDHVPEHECFLEVFGGAAGVLVNKDPDASAVEIYNDADGDLVHFFEVLREQPDELVEWLEAVPYSQQLHNQVGAAFNEKNGFATSKTNSRAQSYSNKIERLEAFADRFREVVIEHLGWRNLLEKSDSPGVDAYWDLA